MLPYFNQTGSYLVKLWRCEKYEQIIFNVVYLNHVQTYWICWREQSIRLHIFLPCLLMKFWMETQFQALKPWSNEDASWRKLKTWVNLRLRLARACVHLRWLAMTCAHFGRDQICTQVDVRFSPFGHPTQVNASWVTSINLLLANKIEDSLP